VNPHFSTFPVLDHLPVERAQKGCYEKLGAITCFRYSMCANQSKIAKPMIEGKVAVAGASMLNRTDNILCRPVTASHFEVERQVEANGIHAEIRRFGWDQACDGHFLAESYYIDYSLIERSPHSRLIHTDHRPTPPPGAIVFLPQGSEFDAHCEPNEQLLLCVTFQHDRAVSLFESDQGQIGLSPCFDVRAAGVRDSLTRLAAELRQPGFGHEVLVETLGLSLVVMLCRHFQARPHPVALRNGRIADWRLRRLKDRIDSGLSGSLSVTSLAEECGMSPRHLIRTFKSTVGVTLSDYIADVRIRRAKQALIRENKMIKVIAGDCGFLSAGAFSAAFHRATGMTPSQFRESHLR
jgi:AraC family transcriptional regulator